MSAVDPAEQAMIDKLPEKTGKTLDEWLGVLDGSGLERHGQVVKELKESHGLTHGYANLIAAYHLGRASRIADGPDHLVEAQYEGAKVGLRPFYEKLVSAVRAFGEDVEIAPKKTYVSLRRKKQFALIQPSTKTRLDVGIKLADTSAGGRLEESGSFNSMVTHRVRIEHIDSIDDELIGWLRAAYDSAG